MICFTKLEVTEIWVHDHVIFIFPLSRFQFLQQIPLVLLLHMYGCLGAIQIIHDTLGGRGG